MSQRQEEEEEAPFRNVDSSSSTLKTTSSSSSPSTSSLNMRQTIMASAISGIVARTLTHPLDTVKARMQAPPQQQPTSTSTFPKRGQNPLAVLRHVWQTEGFRVLYRGYATVIVGGTPGTVVYLSTYEYSKDFLSRRWHCAKNNNESSWDFVIHFASGMLAETLACAVYVPVDVIKERLQVQQSQTSTMTSTTRTVSNVSSSSSLPLYRNGWDALQTIVRTEGWIHGIYRGYGATLLSFGPFAALYFVFYEQAKKQFRGTLTFPQIVACSATAGALASWMTSPLDMAKLRLQIQRRHAGRMTTLTYSNMWECLVHTAQTEGLLGLFRGSLARVLHFTPATAITMTVYELLVSQKWL